MLLVAGVSLSGCVRQAKPTPDQPAGPKSIGMASWYGGKFHGRLTANGERFDKEALTAAHRTLPFGSCVEVENLENGRRVRVRVNDRGPYAEGRIIDVSEAAGRKLDLIERGVARVALRSCPR